MPANCVICGIVCDQRCGRCHAVWYCCAEHQRLDWTVHRDLCSLLQEYYTKQLPAAFSVDSLPLARRHMPRSYYEGYAKALENLAAITFTTDSPTQSAWFDRLSECEQQCTLFSDTRRVGKEIGSQRLELAVRMANQRIAATQILGSEQTTFSGSEYESFSTRTAQALAHAERQSKTLSQQPFDAMRSCQMLQSQRQTAYYCGVFDAHCSAIESLMEASVAEKADILSTAALAMCGVALMVCKERLHESLDRIALLAIETKQSVLDASLVRDE